MTTATTPEFGDNTITVNIRKGNIGNPVLATAAQSVPEDFRGLKHFDFPSPLAVTPGDTYVLQVQATDPTHSWVSTSASTSLGIRLLQSGAFYPGGRAIEFGRLAEDSDMLFQTYTIPEQGKPPTPPSTAQALVSAPPASSLAVERPVSKLEVAGYIETEERDPDDPSVEPEDPVIEWIKFQFPDGIINGESPLVQEGELLHVGFTLNSDKQAIEKIRLSMRALLDFYTDEYEYFYKAEIPANHNQTIDLREHIDRFVKEAPDGSFNLPQESIDILAQIAVSNSGDGEALRVEAYFPNKTIKYTDSDGDHFINPAEEFLEGNVLGIGGGNKLLARTVTEPTLLEITDFQIRKYDNQRLLATAVDFPMIPSSGSRSRYARPIPTTAPSSVIGSPAQPIVAQKTTSAEIRQWATAATASSEYSNPDWSAMQATGGPDTSSCGDTSTAWAPLSDGISPEWIDLDFPTPVQATMLRVHENYNSGFIFQVDVKCSSTNLHTVWTGTDTTPCPGWFEILLPKTSFLVQAVRIHTRISGWEEIDAVQLIGEPVAQTSTPIP